MLPAIQSTARPSGVANPYWITTSKLVRAARQHQGGSGWCPLPVPLATITPQPRTAPSGLHWVQWHGHVALVPGPRVPVPQLCSTDGEGARLCAPSCWAAITIREALGMLINSCIMSHFGRDRYRGCGLQQSPYPRTAPFIRPPPSATHPRSPAAFPCRFCPPPRRSSTASSG